MEEHFPVPRYTAASKIGNSVISLLWQLRCRCKPDHNKFSSSSNTTVVAIFSKLCLWRRSLCSNSGGIGPEKQYRATLSSQTAIDPPRPHRRRGPTDCWNSQLLYSNLLYILWSQWFNYIHLQHINKCCINWPTCIRKWVKNLLE